VEIHIDFREVVKLAKKYDRGPKIVEQATYVTMFAGMALTKRRVQQFTPVGATGELRRGISWEVTKSREAIEGRVTVTGPALSYVEPVEFGSRPHWPPVEPIRYWVLRVLGVPAEEVSRVAFLVSRKIARIGTPKFRMFEQGWAEAEPKVMSLFNVMCYKVVEGIER